MAEKVPRLMPGVDVRKFKLDPTDGFLLTRIDGKLGPKDLARETGLPDFSVNRALEKLEKLAIIEIVDPNAPPPALPPPAAPTPERKSAIALFEGGLLAPKYDPAELEAPAEIPPEQKKRVLDFYYRLDDLDHYTLLGVAKGSDKKSIKRSYFELAAVFHPDRYYGKNLGPFKPKMEVLFNRITEAHDTLVDPAKRADYDAYLAEVATTRGMEAMLERAIAESAAAAAAAAAVAVAVTPTAGAAPPSASGVPSAAPPIGPIVTGPSEEEIKKRRQALAMRLTGGRKSPDRQPSQPSVKPNPLQYANPQDAMDALKRRYVERVESATQAHAKRYIATAEEALAKNDVVAASTAFNLAAKFAPDDETLAARAQEIKALADKTMTESYLKQAVYEERQGHWDDAARSWVRVAKLRGEATDHERAANAIYRSAEGDLHEAAEHAKKAIALVPDRVENHLTLVEVYLKAGLTSSAKRAAESALQLDPKHPSILAALKRIGKP